MSKLGLIASGKRNIKNGNEYNYLFPEPDHERTILKHDGNVEETVFLMGDYINKYHKDTEKIATFLKGKNVKETCFNIWNFVYNHIQYKQDKAGEEQIRRPAFLWKTRTEGGDCDCGTVFICTILNNLKIPFKIRITKYDGKSYYQHVYPIVPYSNGYYVLDFVVNKFNYEKPYSQKKDFTMENLGILITGLHGTEVNEGGLLNDLAGYINDDGLLGNDEDFGRFTGDRKVNLEKRIYDHLVKTRDLVQKYPNLIKTVETPEAFLEMLNYAIKYFYTPNRHLAFAKLAQNEAELNKLMGVTEDQLLGTLNDNDNLELSDDEIDDILDSDDVYGFDALGEYYDDVDGLGKSKKRAAKKAARKAKKTAKKVKKVAKKAKKVAKKLVKKAAKKAKKIVKIKARVEKRAVKKAAKRTGKPVDEILPEEILPEEIQESITEEQVSPETIQEEIQVEEPTVPSEVTAEEAEEAEPMEEYDETELTPEEEITEEPTEEGEEEGESDAVEGWQNGRRIKRPTPRGYFRTIGAALHGGFGDDELDDVDDGLGKKTKEEKAAKKAKRKAKRAEGKGFLHKIKKLNPVFAIPRNAFLLILKTNLFNIAKNYKWGYATPEQAKKGGISDDKYKKSIEAIAKLEKLFVQRFGGEKVKLRKNILASKKARLSGLQGLQNVFGLGIAPAAAAAIVAAAPLVAAALKLLVDSGLMSKKDADLIGAKMKSGDYGDPENPEAGTEIEKAAESEGEEEGKGIMAWVKKNPVITAVGAGAVILGGLALAGVFKRKPKTATAGLKDLGTWYGEPERYHKAAKKGWFKHDQSIRGKARLEFSKRAISGLEKPPDVVIHKPHETKVIYTRKKMQKHTGVKPSPTSKIKEIIYKKKETDIKYRHTPKTKSKRKSAAKKIRAKKHSKHTRKVKSEKTRKLQLT